MVYSSTILIEHEIFDCYDLKLKLRLHLGKGLREVKGFIEVVKHKNTG